MGIVKKDKNIKKVSNITGWSDKKTKEEMDKAKEIGINNFNYIKNECWKLSKDELENLAIELREKKEALIEKRKERIQIICSSTNWSEDKASEHMDNAKEIGINNFNYIKNECWKLSKEELEDLAVKLREKKKALMEKKKERIQIICSSTNWSEDKASEHMDKAKEVGINNLNYIKNKCWKLSNEELETLATKLKEEKEEREKKKEEYINTICQNTDWDRETAIKEMDKAKAIGISNMQYATKNLFEQKMSLLNFPSYWKEEERKGKRITIFILILHIKKQAGVKIKS